MADTKLTISHQHALVAKKGDNLMAALGSTWPALQGKWPFLSVSSQWCLVKNKKQWAQTEIEETPWKHKENLSYCEVDQILEQVAQRDYRSFYPWKC